MCPKGISRMRRPPPSGFWNASGGTVKLSRICPFCGRILLDQRLRINDLAVAAGGENAAKLLNLTVPAKGRNVAAATAAPEWSGDAWTWTAIDSKSKLIVSFVTGDRSMSTALVFLDDLKSRLADRIQLTSDGHGIYVGAVEKVFGDGVDFAQLVKLYGRPEGETSTESRYSPGECTGTKKKLVTGKPDPNLISTSYVERQNLTMRMSMRRFTRLTNAFSKKIDNHAAALALYFVHYNFCRIHKTLRLTSAMAAGITNTLHDVGLIVDLIDESAPKPQKPGP